MNQFHIILKTRTQTVMLFSLLFIAQAFTQGLYAQISISGIVNAYYPVSNIAGNVVTVGTGTGASHTLAPNDNVVLIQMTGIPPVQTGSNMGKYELRKVAAVSGNNITLDGIVNTYSFSTEKVQLVYAPNSTSITVTANVTAKVWDGTTGGVIALKGTNLTLNANIDATGTGFSQANPPTTTITTSLSSGQGSTDGRGFDDPSNLYGGKGGGGIGGGGGAGGSYTGTGGGVGSSGYDGYGYEGYSTNGGKSISGGGGGGGGIIGGGGGGGAGVMGGSGGGGAGGGITGGGGGGGATQSGSGGGGVKGIGNGVPYSELMLDGTSGSGGGSYGGGGGAASAISGGDDSFAGGGGGSWTGGGISGKGGTLYPQTAGAGNNPVSITITNTDHYLNTNQARIMMGGSGGNAPCQNEGKGGGIIILDFFSVTGNNNIIKSNGEGLGLAPYCSFLLTETAISNNNNGSGGAGGGGGGQMILNVKNFTSTTTIEAKGGKGGDGNNNGVWHGGTGGAGGGGGGIWVYSSTASSNTGSQTVNIANTNLTGAGGTAGVAGGSAGADTNNPKNSYRTGTGGAGGNGLIITSNNVPNWGCGTPNCISTISVQKK